MLNIFSAIKLSHYHLVPVQKTNKKGKSVTYKNIYDCGGYGCTYCGDGIKKEFGRRVWLPLSIYQFQSLERLRDRKFRRTCECGGRINVPAFECSNCKDVYRDLKEQPIAQGDTETLPNLLYEKHTCPGCNETVYMDPFYECNQCGLGKPLDIWGVKMELTARGKGKDAELFVDRFRKLKPEEEEQFAHIIAHPVNLSSIPAFRHMSLREQSKRYGIPVPSELAAGGGSGRSRNRSNTNNRSNEDGGGNEGGYSAGASAWD